MTYTELELPFWQNPQFHPQLQYQRDKAIVHVKCYIEINDQIEICSNVLGKFEFIGVKAIEIARHTARLSAQVDAIYRSSILQFNKSSLLSRYQQKANRNAKFFEDRNLYKHYVITSHDCDINIISRTVNFYSLKLDALDTPWLDE